MDGLVPVSVAAAWMTSSSSSLLLPWNEPWMRSGDAR